MEKYGFVYIWYDRKHKRYYVGCRWGNEDDGYICSSSWMKKSYKYRPEDFKRKILSRVYTNRQDLLEEEFKFLSMIKTEELGKKYYNLRNHHYRHWSENKNNRLSIGEKISISHKGKRFSPETEIKKGQRLSPQTEFKTGQSPHNKGKNLSTEQKQKLSDAKIGKPNNSSTKFKKGQVSWNSGLKRYYITDGINNKAIYDDSFIIPYGWKRGMTKKKKV